MSLDCRQFAATILADNPGLRRLDSYEPGVTGISPAYGVVARRVWPMSESALQELTGLSFSKGELAELTILGLLRELQSMALPAESRQLAATTR